MRKMGGLQKHMPITRWTYLIATIAIAGFPVANGFFSKDEILWKAFTSHHLALFGQPTPWLGPAIYVIGLIAATGTSFYMYRSYYMTFTGEYRGGGGHGHDDPHPVVVAPATVASATVQAGGHGHDGHGHGAAHGHDAGHAAAHGHDDDAHGDAHGHHGGTPHESPWQITLVLSVLAAGSVATLFLGIPAAWSHVAPALEHWLEPALTAKVEFGEPAHWMEFLFQGMGVLAAAIGFVAARAIYKDNRNEAALKAGIERWKGVWTTVYNKYYVDELYALIVLRPAKAVARAFSWVDGSIVDGLVNGAGVVTRAFANLDGAIDTYIVDGAVNAVADGTIGLGRSLRLFQTGRIQTYLYGALGGALVVVLLNFLLP
jgi:NADH-quinone oxidoreductase subunit L